MLQNEGAAVSRRMASSTRFGPEGGVLASGQRATLPVGLFFYSFHGFTPENIVFHGGRGRETKHGSTPPQAGGPPLWAAPL